MGDNDFPSLLSKETSNPRSPYDIYKVPDWAKPKYPEPPDPEEDESVKKADATSYLQQYVAGMDRYQQEGPSIPTFGVQSDYAQEAGGPLIGQSFEIPVDIDSPAIDRWLEQERQKPGYVPVKIPTGPELQRRIQNFRDKYRHLLV